MVVEEEIGEGGSCRLGKNGGGARGGEAWQRREQVEEKEQEG